MRKKSSFLLLVGLVVLVALSIGVVYVRFYLGPKLAEKGLEKVIQSGLGGKATVSQVVIHWLGRPGIEYREFSIRGAKTEEDWLRVERIVVRPRLRSLFSKSIQWKSLALDHPIVRLSEARGQIPLARLVSIFSQFDRLELKSGKIAWPDREIRELFVSLSDLSTSGPFPLVLRGALRGGSGSPAWVSIHGLIVSPSQKWDLSALKLSADIEGQGLDPNWFGGPLVQYIPSELLGCRITLSARYDGDIGGRFQTSGTLSIVGSSLVEKMGELTAKFALDWDGQELRFRKVLLQVPDFPLEVEGRIHARQGAEPLLSFRVNCPWMAMAKYRKAFPFLPENVRSFLGSFQQGEVALTSLGFAGPLGGLGPPKDEESLGYWKGQVRFRNLIRPWKGDSIRLREGSARIDQGTILAEAVGVSFGDSELEIPHLSLSQLFSGRSVDLVLKGQVSLADMPEWISAGLMAEKMAFLLSKMEVLSGRGNVDLRVEASPGLSMPPAVDGSLYLKDLALRIPLIPGTFKRLEGIVEFCSGDVLVRSIKGRWRSSTVSAEGLVRSLFSEEPQIDLSVQGRFNLRDLDELASWDGLPKGTRLVLQEIGSPSGEGDYALRIRGALSAPQRTEFSGELAVREGSFRLWNTYPVQGVTGRILLSGDRIWIPDLSGTWKNSNIALKDFQTRPGPTFLRDLTFSATFDLQDIASGRFDYGSPKIWKRFIEPFDFREGKAFVRVVHRKRGDQTTVEGHVTFREATARHLPVFPFLTSLDGDVSFAGDGIKTLNVQGEFDSSPVKIEGDLASGTEESGPHLSIHAEKIDLEKVLSWPWNKGFSGRQKSQRALVVHVRIDHEQFREITLSDVEAKLRFEQDRLSFEEVTFFSAEGPGFIRGWVGFEKDGHVSFEFWPYFLNVKAGPILMSFQGPDSKRQLSGLASASGVIKGRGKSLLEVARSLEGEVVFLLREGRIAQFTVLSKVFSLLDLSQLVQGNFPDLKTEGTTYRTITGQVNMKGGKASTSDLLLESDSMKISVVGDLDIPSGSLDLLLGLRRVGAGGKIVRAIPVFGEIVTTDEGSFINYYLKVKGTIAEPEVKGIPYMSLSEGVSGFLRRLLETPGEIIPLQRQPALKEYFEQRKHPYP